MKIGVVSGIRYKRVDGRYYTDSQFDSEMWGECLDSFTEVILVPRVFGAETIDSSDKLISVEGIRLIEFPDFHGIWGTLKAVPRMLLIARKAVHEADVWHLHAASIISTCVWIWAFLYRIPYSLEFRGDQGINSEYLRLRGMRCPSVVSRFMKFLWWLHMLNPVAVVSVAQFLVDLARPRKNCRVHIASNARIPLERFSPKRVWTDVSSEKKIICMGRLEAQKNPLGVIRALSHLERKGLSNWRLSWLGDGPLRKDAQCLSGEMGLSEKIQFPGFVPWEEIFPILQTTGPLADV